MAYYENNDDSSSSNPAASWSAQNRQPSWEHQQSASQSAPSRSNTSSAMSHRPDFGAFASQFEEIERATDNLIKSGKWFPGQAQAGAQNPMQPLGIPRRDSVPGGPQFGADPRMGVPPPRHHAGSGEFDVAGGNRPGSAGLQGFYAGQRFPGARQSDAEQVLQAKRRMAAQRERELRNYHQEQQYNRTSSGGSSSTNNNNTTTTAKPGRAMSPNAMSEEDRRELIARQHRALYGENSQLYGADGQGQSTRQSSQDARIPSGGRGTSPLAFDPYGAQAQSGAEGGGVQMPPRDRAENTSSPALNPPNQQNYNHLSEVSQAGRTSNSSPGGSPPLIQGQKGGVAPIGTRPMQNSGAAKRATTPLTPSSLSYGFPSADGQKPNNGKDERSASAASNANSAVQSEKGVAGLPGWASNSGVRGSGKSSLAVQPSVWG